MKKRKTNLWRKALIIGFVFSLLLVLASVLILNFSVNSFYNLETTTKGREIQLPVTVASGSNKPIVCVIIADEYCYSELRDPTGNRVEYWPNLDTAGFLKTNGTKTGTWWVVVKSEPGNNEFKVSLTSNYPLGEKSLLEPTELRPILSVIVVGIIVPIVCALITAKATTSASSTKKCELSN